MSDLKYFEGSALGGSLKVFCSRKLLAFHRPIFLGVSNFFTRSFCCFYLSGRFMSGYPHPMLPFYHRGLFEVLGWTALLLRATPQEVLSLPNVIIVL